MGHHVPDCKTQIPGVGTKKCPKKAKNQNAQIKILTFLQTIKSVSPKKCYVFGCSVALGVLLNWTFYWLGVLFIPQVPSRIRHTLILYGQTNIRQGSISNP